MDRLRSWWRWWKEGEADIDRRAGRDERYRRIEGDALRIAARTIPISVLLVLVAGRFWLPETIGRTDALQLAAVAGGAVLGVFWLTVKMVKDRRGAILSALAMPPSRVLVQYAASALGIVTFALLFNWLLGWPFNWSTILGVLTGLAVWSLVTGVRWRRERGRARAG
jgi:uncharacterized integral membrane protein